MDESDFTDAETALHGALLAHTALNSALIAVLKAKGLLSEDEVNVIFDAAILQAETSPAIGGEAAKRARKTLETIHHELGGPVRPQV